MQKTCAEPQMNAFEKFTKEDLVRFVAEMNSYIRTWTAVGLHHLQSGLHSEVQTEHWRSLCLSYHCYLDQSHFLQYVHAVVASVKEEDHPPYLLLLISL